MSASANLQSDFDPRLDDPGTGLITSQTDPAEGVETARSTYGVTGAGITVGIISDSFNLTDPVTAQAPNGDNEAFDIANGDLPADTTILKDGNVKDGDMDEGRAIGELVHDIAPSAAIDFYAAGDSQQDMATAILALAKAGAKIIIDDIGFPDEPAYQDGVIAQAIDEAVQDYGVTYFSAAGNANGEGWEGRGAFQANSTALVNSNGQIFVDPNTNSSALYLQQFGGNSEAYLPLTASFTSEYAKDDIPTDVQVTLEWNQPYASGSSSGPTSQVELLIQDTSTGRLISASSQGDQSVSSTGEAAQVVDFQPVSGHAYRILVADANARTAAPPTDVKIVVYSADEISLGDATTTAAAETTATSYGHPTAADAISVGAADYTDTPAYGVSPPVAESFSSSGPQIEYFSADGTPLATPTYGHGPDITAADGGDTTFFPEYPGSDTDGDGYPNFYGTSAASGDAAGVAALILQADPNLIWSQVEGLLEVTAIPMADPDQTGAGLIQADTAVGVAELLLQVGGTPVFGTNGADLLAVGAGTDTVVGGPGADVITAGSGADTFLYTALGDSTSSAYDVIESFQSGTDKVDVAPVAGGYVEASRFDGDTFVYFDPNGSGGFQGLVEVTAALAAGDINAGSATLELTGDGAASETLDGSAGHAILVAGSGVDTLIGGPADQIYAGSGADTFVVPNAAAAPAAEFEAIVGFKSGTDTLDVSGADGGLVETVTYEGDTFVYFHPNASGGFDDAVEVEGALTGADLKISAQAAAYGLVIVGSQGAETLTGSVGHDYIYAGSGTDTIIGGGGADFLIGGAGADTYLYTSVNDSTSSAADYIYSFDPQKGDVIDLSQLDAIPSTPAQDHFTLVSAFTGQAGQLIVTTPDANDDFYIEGDTTGSGMASFEIFVHLTGTMDLSHIHLS